ncbi:MAG: hypothetical protein HUJ61_05300 [Bacilli bacterium]|nr:hypothetical protein [Bacilli bacterium]
MNAKNVFSRNSIYELNKKINDIAVKEFGVHWNQSETVKLSAEEFAEAQINDPLFFEHKVHKGRSVDDCKIMSRAEKDSLQRQLYKERLNNYDLPVKPEFVDDMKYYGGRVSEIMGQYYADNVYTVKEGVV